MLIVILQGIVEGKIIVLLPKKEQAVILAEILKRCNFYEMIAPPYPAGVFRPLELLDGVTFYRTHGPGQLSHTRILLSQSRRQYPIPVESELHTGC